MYPTVAITKQKRDLTELIKTAYGFLDNSQRFLTFYSEELDLEMAKIAVRAIGEYNAFEYTQVNACLEKIAKRFPNVRFIVGRESSPVIYLTWNRYTEDKLDIDIVKAFLDEAEADEINHYDHLHSFPYGECIRAWWD